MVKLLELVGSANVKRAQIIGLLKYNFNANTYKNK